LSAQQTTATTLSVSGLPAAFEKAFSVTLHSYEVPARSNVPGYRFHAPLTPPSIPATIGSLVVGMAGLDSRPSMKPQLAGQLQPDGVRLGVGASAVSAADATASVSTGDEPGAYTVLDFAKFYDVTPLYQRGISGAGQRLGIMTLAAFTPGDAFAYWRALGLQVDPQRLSIVNVDGGPGAPSDLSGSLETTIDVEQSGGIAPAADITVYQAPNTTQGFVDLIATAVDRNWASSLSISWGEWEWFDNVENSPVSEHGQTVSTLQAVHQLLLRAALQGQTVFAASGDGGAYDADNDGFGPPDFSLVLSVDYPASDQAITAAGGTTLPATLTFGLPSGKDLVIHVPRERVWGWDYLQPLCQALRLDPVSCGIFPAGSGGGVSVYFTQPFYQWAIPGTQLSQPGQKFIEYLPSPPQLLFALPGFFPGRNVPDVSFNADPETGYAVYYTSDQQGFSIQTGWGGTSFVAPQLNGVTALLGQDLRGRLGLLNGFLYELVRQGQAYAGRNAPLNVISAGDNWFYNGRNGYSPAVGVGTMDVANFAETLRGSWY
jgi:subtilase family serine protease